MKKFIWSEIIGVIFVLLVGSFSHFTFEWSNENTIIALFSAVNESTWEHLKLLFFPFLLYSILEYFFIGKNYRNFITSKLIGVIVGLLVVPILFYSYTSILGTNYLLLDIMTFAISVIVAFLVDYYFIKRDSFAWNKISVVCFIFIALLFFALTFKPPHIRIFLDTVENKYGLLSIFRNINTNSR